MALCAGDTVVALQWGGHAVGRVMDGAYLIQALDLAGTLVFALSGAVVGARRGMDLFGVLVLAFVTAVAGGILRDLLIGAVPPAAIASAHALVLSCAAGLFGARFPQVLERLNRPVLLFDAAGLGIFAATGTQTAIAHGIPPVMAAVLGMVSGIGGGMVRDVLTAQVPVVLRAEIYALAALAGAAVVAGGHALGFGPTATVLPGAALCLFLRLMAIYRGWSLPAIGGARERT